MGITSFLKFPLYRIFEKLTKSNGAPNVTDEMDNNTNKDLMFPL